MKGLRKWLFALFAIAIAFGMSACSNDGADDANREESSGDGKLSGEVTLWTSSLSGEPFDSYFDEIERAFEELHPDVDVIIEDIPHNEIEQKVLTSLTGDDVPDVVNLNPHFMSNIVAQGGLLDLTDLVSEETNHSFLKGPFESGFVDGKLYALPWYLTTTVSWYNNEHFEQAGITETPDTTQGIYDTAKAITEVTGKPSFYQVINDGHVIIEKMITLSNGEPIVKDGKAVFQDNEEILEFYNIMQKMYEEGLMPQENADGSFSTGQELYMAENVSFLESGVTFLGPIESGAPEVFSRSKAGPPLNDIHAPMDVAVMNFTVPVKTKNPEAAVALAEFVTNSENQLEFAKVAGTVLPSTTESLKDDYFTNPGDSPKALGMLEAAKSLERSKVLIPPIESNAELRDTAKNVFVENLLGDLTPQAALDKLAEQWNKILEENGDNVTF